MHFLASSVMAALWAIARARPWSLRTLGILDGGSLLLAGVGLGADGGAARRKAAHGRAVRADGDDDGAGRPDPVDGRCARSACPGSPSLRSVVSFVFHQPAAMPGFAPGFLKALISVNALLWLIIATSRSRR